jgi:hypothetical protein
LLSKNPLPQAPAGVRDRVQVVHEHQATSRRAERPQSRFPTRRGRGMSSTASYSRRRHLRHGHRELVRVNGPGGRAVPRHHVADARASTRRAAPPRGNKCTASPEPPNSLYRPRSDKMGLRRVRRRERLNQSPCPSPAPEDSVYAHNASVRRPLFEKIYIKKYRSVRFAEKLWVKVSFADLL